MAYTTNVDKVVRVGNGGFFIAPVGTVRPVDLTKIDEAWIPLGQSSIDNIFPTSADGGDTTNLSTLQVNNVRQSRTAVSETWNPTLMEWTAQTLQLYFGKGTVVAADGAIEVAGTGEATEHAFLGVFNDGDNILGVHTKRASIGRGDAWSIGGKDDLNGFQLAVSPLAYQDEKSAFAIIPPKAVA